MPELPEVETVKRGLQPAMEGARIVRVEQRRKDLRFPFPPRFGARLRDRQVMALSRRAKYLLADLDSGEVLIMHLGMSGRFIVEMDGRMREPGEFSTAITRHLKHDHVVFHLSNGAMVTYNDVRRFGYMDLVKRENLAQSVHFKAMGIEPLGNALVPETVAALFADKSTSLKAALLDQRLIAGLGNIYVCEALFRAGLAPTRAAGSLVTRSGQPTAKLKELIVVIRDVLSEAVEAGGSTLRDYAHTDGSLGYFQHRFKVYDREGEPCPNPACRGLVARFVQSGRSTFHCAACQA
jgi:formamidopyrimidine-DNA glycosylase